jgi:hypothetical protein
MSVDNYPVAVKITRALNERFAGNLLPLSPGGNKPINIGHPRTYTGGTWDKPVVGTMWNMEVMLYDRGVTMEEMELIARRLLNHLRRLVPDLKADPHSFTPETVRTFPFFIIACLVERPSNEVHL